MRTLLNRSLPLLAAIVVLPPDVGVTRAVGTIGAPQSAVVVTGTVFADRNGNGRRDTGEPGLPGVAISDQDAVVVTDARGAYRLTSNARSHLVFVSVPDGYRSRAPFYRTIDASATPVFDFPLVAAAHGQTMTFIHASDTHISEASRPRTQRLRAIIDSVRPDFVLVTGDLVRDALRVGEVEATSYYQLFNQEAARVTQPLWTVPGNHENFGIERDKSGVAADHPLYGRAMYHHFRGPDYYSFTTGGVHFVALNTVDIDDTRYYGHVDSLQLEWLSRDLAAIPPTMPVITYNHIPFFTAMETVNGYMDQPPAPSVITVGGKAAFRHSVSNAAEVMLRIRPHPYPIALGGHMHAPERLRFAGIETRFELAAAVVGPTPTRAMLMPSGVTVYHLAHGTIDEGRFVPLGLDRAPDAGH